MILDNEEQRQVLLKIINNCPLTGNIRSLTQDLIVLQKLIDSIKNATIKEEGK